jgi:hypothetical protein
MNEQNNEQLHHVERAKSLRSCIIRCTSLLKCEIDAFEGSNTKGSLHSLSRSSQKYHNHTCDILESIARPTDSVVILRPRWKDSLSTTPRNATKFEDDSSRTMKMLTIATDKRIEGPFTKMSCQGQINGSLEVGSRTLGQLEARR